jgi:hypothetical protein
MEREYKLYDLLVYHDLDSYITPELGMTASELGFSEQGHVVALGPPIHDGRVATAVIAARPGPMPEVQSFLDARTESHEAES